MARSGAPTTSSQSDVLNNLLATPHCKGIREESSASTEREKLRSLLSISCEPNHSDNYETSPGSSMILSTPLGVHLAHGLAYTVGSALGSIPPTVDVCLTAFTFPNKVGLTAGAKAWSKHAHRSLVEEPIRTSAEPVLKKKSAPSGWWGTPSGPVAVINENALSLFWKITKASTWRNLHWLPHSVLVYEVRVPEGYGMRWSQDQSDSEDDGTEGPPWIFRGFVEPMMENGHEIGWRHAP